MAKKKSSGEALREPAPREADQIRKSEANFRARATRTEAAMRDGALTTPHSDAHGFALAMMDVFGSRSGDFMHEQVNFIGWAGKRRGDGTGNREVTATGFNAGLAIVQAVAPANEVEAALAVQMAGAHSLASELIGRAKLSDRSDHVALYGGLAVKLMRTFTMQVETLARLRSGGRQVVEVKHVHVNGNAVIGNVHQGGGSTPEIVHQPHAPCPALADGATVRSALQADGHALQGASDADAEALPDARRG